MSKQPASFYEDLLIETPKHPSLQSVGLKWEQCLS